MLEGAICTGLARRWRDEEKWGEERRKKSHFDETSSVAYRDTGLIPYSSSIFQLSVGV
jgi:hypothetical protein